MNDWLNALAMRLRARQAVVRVIVAGVRGSAPREPGACMLVSAEPAVASLSQRAVEGTIGGGHLEWKAITVARLMLAQGTVCWTDRYTLGASLGQCCGGVVELQFERYDAADLIWVEDALKARVKGAATLTTLAACTTAAGTAWVSHRSLQCGVDEETPSFAASPDGDGLRLVERLDLPGTPLMLFGAGHVGSALVRILGELPLRVTWVDNREEQFGAYAERLPCNVTPLLSDQPEDEVDTAPPQSYFLVLTHSHDLDFEIGRAILQRRDFAWAGVIGSETKAASFAARWERQGFRRKDISRICCPIGIPGIASKHPSAIAVSVAAQVQQVMEAGVPQSVPRVTAQRAGKAVDQRLHAVQPEALAPAHAGTP